MKNRWLPVILAAVGGVILGMSTPAVARQVSHMINGSTIKKHTISGNRLKPNTLTGKQIKESTLATVPKAQLANTLPALTVHPVTLMNEWTNDTPLLTVGYTIDAQGVVHLQGRIANSNGFSGAAFDLPAAARPPVDIQLMAYEHSGYIGQVNIGSDGAVTAFPAVGLASNDSSAAVDLDSISFVR